MAPELKDLRKECKDAGLDYTGKISELVQRLKDPRDCKESSSEDQDPTCDAILVTQLMIGDVDDMKRDPHDAFKETLEVEGLEVRVVMDEVYVGNPRGLGLAGLPERMQLLEEEDIRNKATIAELKAETTQLNDYVSVLRLAGPEYKRVRNRFHSAFKRDKLKLALKKWDRDIIDGGNVAAHSGDVVIDALLYDAEGRQDSYIFEALYGLHPSDAKKISHKEIIEILNRYATVIAN